MALNRTEIFYFCADKMKNRLIQHSILLLVFICLLQVMGSVYMNFPDGSAGKRGPVKATMEWTVWNDTSNVLTEALPDGEQGTFVFSWSAGWEPGIGIDPVRCFVNSPEIKDGYIPLHLSDSSPPVS
jgi:hypothetical protein